MARRVLGLYVGTTLLAVSGALALTDGLGPSRGATRVAVAGPPREGASPPSGWEVTAERVPSNPIRAMAEGRMLPVMVLALLVGRTLVGMARRGSRRRERLEGWNDVLRAMVGRVRRAAPGGGLARIACTLAI